MAGRKRFGQPLKSPKNPFPKIPRSGLNAFVLESALAARADVAACRDSTKIVQNAASRRIKSGALRINAKFSIRSVLVAFAAVAVFFNATLLPRFRESQSQRIFSSKGSVFGSTIDLFEPSFLDSLFLFPGFVQQATLDGTDERLGEQIGALPSFEYLTHLNAVTVEEDLKAGRDFRLPQPSSASFSFCASDFARAILKNAPELREISIFECTSIDDQVLAAMEASLSLEAIQIDGSSASGTFAARLERLPSFRKMAIRNSPITNQGLEAIGRLGQLEHLEIMQTSVDLDPLKLQNLRALKHLELVNFLDDDLAIQRLSKALPNTVISVDGETVETAGANVEEAD